jgi:protein O-mannosyl-transferase
MPMIFERSHNTALYAFLVAMLCLFTYSNTFSMHFVWDDIGQIKENVSIKALHDIPALFESDVWQGVKGDHPSPYYRPVFTTSLALDHSLWGENPFGYHLTNLVLHVLVSILVYLLALKIVRHSGAALLAGLLFAVHPVHSGAVAWISGRSGPLAALFMFLSLYLYISYKEERNLLYLAVSLFAFLLALLSKETAITLPLIVLLYEICFGDRKAKKIISPFILYCLAAIPYFILRLSVLKVMGWSNQPLSHRLYTSFGMLVGYVRLLVAPVNLRVFYDIPIKRGFLEKDVIIPLLLLALMAAGIFLLFRRNRKLFFCIAWIPVTLIPVSGIPTLIYPSPMAERYLYIPSAGFAMAAGLMAYRSAQVLLERNATGHRRASIVLVAAIVLIFALLNYQRNYCYKNQYIFLNRIVRDAPGFYGGHSDLGAVYAEEGRFADAKREFLEALKLKPDSDSVCNNLGALYMQLGEKGRAAELFRSALGVNPGNANARYNLGRIYAGWGRYGEAERELRLALKSEPQNRDIYYRLGDIYMKEGRFDDAERAFRQTLSFAPDNAFTYYNLGVVYIREGNMEKAIEQIKHAVHLDPGNEVFRKGLEKAYEMRRDRQR